MTMAEARRAIAEAVSGATGMTCDPYAPDTANLPAAFVDMVTTSYDEGASWGSFCAPGTAVATVVTAAMRNDKAASQEWLESHVPAVIKALADLPTNVTRWQSGITTINGQECPALIYTCSFGTE